MGKVIELENGVEFNWLFATVEIRGRELMVGTEIRSNQPMVADRARQRAWVGGWDELAEMVAADLEQEEPDDATQKSV